MSQFTDLVAAGVIDPSQQYAPEGEDTVMPGMDPGVATTANALMETAVREIADAAGGRVTSFGTGHSALPWERDREAGC